MLLFSAKQWARVKHVPILFQLTSSGEAEEWVAKVERKRKGVAGKCGQEENFRVSSAAHFFRGLITENQPRRQNPPVERKTSRMALPLMAKSLPPR